MAGALRRPFPPGSIASMRRRALRVLALSFAATRNSGVRAGVLDVAIDGSDWRDFTTVGECFDEGGYDARAFAGNPLGARPAWGRDAALPATRAQLPASLARHWVRLRFRPGSGGAGERWSGCVVYGFSLRSPLDGERGDDASAPPP